MTHMTDRPVETSNPANTNPAEAIRCVEQRPIDELKPFARNARRHSARQIKLITESIKAFGFTNPILVDEEGVILAGHGRLAAAKALGMASVPVLRLKGMSEAQKRAYVLADNRIAEKAGWDRELLAIELGALADLLPTVSLDISVTGFGIGEIDMLMDDLGPAKPDAADRLPKQVEGQAVVTRPSDLWLLGKHRLLCGDTRDRATIDQLMAGETAKMIFTDPPYNVRIAGHVQGRGQTKHREFDFASGEMDEASFIAFLTETLGNLRAVSSDDAIAYVCMDWRHMGEMLAAGKVVFDSLRNLCVWAKTSPGQGSFYRSQHELVFVFKTGSEAHANSFGLGADHDGDGPSLEAGRTRSNLWTYPGINAFGKDRLELLRLHPTVKPVALVADAMRDCSARNDIILDGFAGSGTILLAAEKVGRRGFGLEIDPEYCDVAIARWQQMTGGDVVHAATGLTFDALGVRRAAADRVVTGLSPGTAPMTTSQLPADTSDDACRNLTSTSSDLGSSDNGAEWDKALQHIHLPRAVAPDALPGAKALPDSSAEAIDTTTDSTTDPAAAMQAAALISVVSVPHG